MGFQVGNDKFDIKKYSNRKERYFTCESCGKFWPLVCKVDDFVDNLCGNCEIEHREAMEAFSRELCLEMRERCD